MAPLLQDLLSGCGRFAVRDQFSLSGKSHCSLIVPPLIHYITENEFKHVLAKCEASHFVNTSLDHRSLLFSTSLPFVRNTGKHVSSFTFTKATNSQSHAFLVQTNDAKIEDATYFTKKNGVFLSRKIKLSYTITALQGCGCNKT